MLDSFHTAVQIDYDRWAVTFVCQFGVLSATWIMSAAEFVKMIEADARNGEEAFLIDDAEQIH